MIPEFRVIFLRVVMTLYLCISNDYSILKEIKGDSYENNEVSVLSEHCLYHAWIPKYSLTSLAFRKMVRGCYRSPEGKGLMCMSQIPTAGRLQSWPRIVGHEIPWKRTRCGWRRYHAEVGQYFSRINILVLAPRHKHNTVLHKCRNEVEKWTLSVCQGLKWFMP